MTEAKKGDRIRLTIEGTTTYLDYDEVNLELDNGIRIYIEASDRFLYSEGVTIEVLEPTNQELFEALPLGANFKLDGEKGDLTYVKVATNAYGALTPWKLHDGYFDGEEQYARYPLLSPSGINPDFTVTQV